MKTIVDKFDQGIVALIQHGSIKKAAAALGINPATLWRWCQTPEFQERYRLARHQMYSDSLAGLREKANLAVDTLVSMLQDTKTPPATRLRIAQLILQHSVKGYVLAEPKLEDFQFDVADAESAGAGSAGAGSAGAAPCTKPVLEEPTMEVPVVLRDGTRQTITVDLKSLEEARRLQMAAAQTKGKSTPGTPQTEAVARDQATSGPPNEPPQAKATSNPRASYRPLPKGVKPTATQPLGDWRDYGPPMPE